MPVLVPVVVLLGRRVTDIQDVLVYLVMSGSMIQGMLFGLDWRRCCRQHLLLDQRNESSVKRLMCKEVSSSGFSFVSDMTFLLVDDRFSIDFEVSMSYT